MGRTYDDPSYRSKKQSPMPSTGALNGTVTSATSKSIITVMQPITLKDWNLSVTTGGVMIDTNVLIGKSLAGTGAVSAIGTITLTGTKTALDVVDGSLTATNFSTGDDIVVQRAAGTETGVAVVTPYFQYVENFEQADS